MVRTTPLGWFLVSVLLLVAGTAGAATRLGLMVTQEELTIWQGRANGTLTGSVNGVTYQNIYNARIKADADTFVAQSGSSRDGLWPGWTGAGCAPTSYGKTLPYAGGTPFGRGNGAFIARAAFTYLLTGTASYGNAVASVLNAQAADPGTDWSNSSKWCIANMNGSDVFETVPWIYRLLLAYDYLIAGGYTGFTTPQRNAIVQWFVNAEAFWHQGQVSGVNVIGYPGIYDTPQNLTCVGGNCTSNAQLLWFGGPTMKTATYNLFYNQSFPTPLLSMAVGILADNATAKAHGIAWITAFLKAGLWDNGASADLGRWSDCNPFCPGSAWAHAGGVWAAGGAAIDLLARTGDTSLYTLSGPTQVLGGSGSTVSWLTAVDLIAKMANDTTVLWGTNSAGDVGNPAFQITWDVPASLPNGMWYDLALLPANIYYQDSDVHTSTHRTLLGSNSNVNGCYDNQYGGCFSGVWGFWPDIAFMYGNLDSGQINPYSLTAGGTAPILTIETPTTGATHATTGSTLTTLAGTATDDVGVTSVTWACPTCTPTSGTATCASCGASATLVSWSAASITLAAGVNQITVTANDGSLTGTDTLRVLSGTPNLTSNKVLHLPFEEPSGTTADDIGTGNNDATVSAGITRVTGRVGAYAVHLTDNSSHLITVSGSTVYATTAAAFSVALWTNLSAFTLAFDYPQPINLRSNGSLTFEVDYSNDATNNCLGVSFGNSGGGFTPLRWIAASAADLLGWHHLAIVYNGAGATTAANYTLYWDGEPQTLAVSSCPAGKSQATTLGGYAADGQNEDWQGDLDDAYVFARALSAVDVYGLYQLTPTAAVQAPVILRLLR